MWTYKKLYDGATKTNAASLPCLFVTPAAIMFNTKKGSGISMELLAHFHGENKYIAASLISGLIPSQESKRHPGTPANIEQASSAVWLELQTILQEINSEEQKMQVLCRYVHEYLPSEKVRQCARLFGVLSSSPSSRPKYPISFPACSSLLCTLTAHLFPHFSHLLFFLLYQFLTSEIYFDELEQLWAPLITNVEVFLIDYTIEYMEIVNTIVSHGMCEINTKELCIRAAIPLVRYYRTVLSFDECRTVYNRFLSPHATTLHKAALHDYTELADDILSKNSTIDVVDARDNGSWTPLLFAAQNGAFGVCKLLVAKGADVNAMENTNQTPLHRACHSGSMECVKLLLENGANLNHMDKYGIPPVLIAIGEGHEEVAEYLLGLGAQMPEKLKHMLGK